MIKGMAKFRPVIDVIEVFIFEGRCTVLDSGDSAIPCYGWGVIARMVITDTRFFPLISSGP